MAVSDEISRIKGNIASAYSSAGAKGATLPAVQNSANLAGCIDTITGGGGGEEERLGVKFSDMLGTVDAEGNYTMPTDSVVVDLTGVKGIVGIGRAFANLFYGKTNVVGVIANDFVAGDASTGLFQNFVAYCTQLETFEFNGLESITASGMFSQCNYTGSLRVLPHFNRLKSVSGDAAFQNSFNSSDFDVDEAFPVLEYIAGNNTFATFKKTIAGSVLVFSSVKTIVGGNASYYSTLGSYYLKDMVWKFPSATKFMGYIWNIMASYAGEIHFAAANQAAIEACDGYADKWGFAGATIYFDLMSTITVDGVDYARGHTIGGYTDWSDESGNIIYTDATAEPAVGTVVYSDKGATQVGTVEGVA